MTDIEQKVLDQTNEHIETVRSYLNKIANELKRRADCHDDSKLKDPEWPIFLEYTPKLWDTPFGSPEYEQNLKGMKVGLDHHYASNSHHPQFYENGILDMSLCDLIEMMCDWKAATLRHKDGSMEKSFDINRERFEIPSHIEFLLRLIVKEME